MHLPEESITQESNTYRGINPQKSITKNQDNGGQF